MTIIGSILNDIKKLLGLAETYTVFDRDVIMHINSAMSTLNQLGVGPVQGFSIQDDSTTWDSFLDGDPRFNNVETYVYLRVRLLFDPPATSFTITAMQDQIKELEWRINAQKEVDQWTPEVTIS